MTTSTANPPSLKPPSLKPPSLGSRAAIASLGQQLQQLLASELPQNIPIVVRCSLKDGHLMVLAEHLREVRPDLEKTFRILQQAVLSIAPELSGELRLYLRVSGEKHPYAYHAFRMPRPVGAQATPTLSLPIFAENTIDPWEQQGSSLDANPLRIGTKAATTKAAMTKAATAPEKPQELAKELASADFPSQSKSPRPSEEWGALASSTGKSAIKGSSPTAPRLRKIKRKTNSSSRAIAFGVLPILLGIAAFAWALTRPCVMGECPELAKAEELKEAAQKNLAVAQYQQHLTSSKQQLERASQILKTIPPWSGKAFRSRQQEQRYQIEAEGVERAIKAMEIGGKAAGGGKNPPHLIGVWQQVQSQWYGAIALLEQIPPDAAVYPFAKQKLTEYRRNLAAINGRIQAEETATKLIEEAKSVAKAAQTRASVALGISGWQDVSQLWQKAAVLLGKVPQGTTTYREARQLLKDYDLRLAEARERQTKEEISSESYEEARTWAEQARELDRKRQWARARDYWREALNYARGVVADTFYYPKAQEDINAYIAAIQYDEAQIKSTFLLKKGRQELNKICAGSPVVCEYTIAEDLISVWLSAAYVRQVRRTAIIADRSGDRKTLANVDDRIQKLRSALEKISNNSGIPLILYDPYGAPIGRHAPS